MKLATRLYTVYFLILLGTVTTTRIEIHSVFCMTFGVVYTEIVLTRVHGYDYTQMVCIGGITKHEVQVDKQSKTVLRLQPVDFDYNAYIFWTFLSFGKHVFHFQFFPQARIQGWVDKGSGSPLDNHKAVGFLSYSVKSQSYQARIQCWAIIWPPAKRHSAQSCKKRKTELDLSQTFLDPRMSM